ncbi:hypothetical protein ARAM_003900, partial [Aspergillus rambellii]
KRNNNNKFTDNFTTQAHTHARNAVLETRKSNPVAASEEHDLAAGEFATIAESSTDREALRTLQLLEHHHKKLAQILRFQHEHPPSTSVTPATAAAVSAQGLPAESGASKAFSPISDTQQQPPKLSGNPRLPTRETSSIASNLASARGIPAQPRRASPASPTLSSQQAGARMTDSPGRIRTTEARLRGTQTPGERERGNRASAQKQSWSLPAESPTDITSQQFVPANPGETAHQPRGEPAADEGFQRFYSTFEGLISRISAPLAFAGLPLGSDGPQAGATTRKSSADTKVDRYSAVSDRSMSSAEPDIDRIFSRAALRAIRDSTGGSGGMGTGGAAESFYIVPTTGGTVSYAGILTRAEKEARRNSLDDGDEDFVDARETPSSPEMLQSLTASKGKIGRGGDKLTGIQSPKTMEELQMENQALRHLSDTLSKRLHMWEVNAQSSSMALQQSLRAMHHQNAPSADPGPHLFPPAVSPLAPVLSGLSIEQDQRIKELEELVRLSERELDKVGRENEKLRNVLGRYRERWEKLKEGAKTRRESKSGGEGSVRNGGAAAAAAVHTNHPGADTEDTTSNEPDV